ncbi:Pre-rRNA-processing protein ESF2 [Pseudocercospora fuligena]|uniref:18S rRNA factor 2 n=1 Tax=Pseudocercospora fuligena TaxID=685502 RepID=A0A8H6REQ5_9PEZI|nr:Pre-rRNA-processing protein ESF2 [Pseudocercospora fuligena]
MSVRKRNEFLEGDESDGESENGYDSEAEEGRGAIANKRRKIDTESGSEASFDGVEDEEERPEPVKAVAKDSRFDLSNFEAEEEEAILEQEDETESSQSKPKKSKAQKEVEAAAKKTRKSGVIYISRVPPFMKPQTLKHFLAPHASKGLNRIFLTPEDHTQHQNRVKRGGNKKKSYTDGWVEFNSKTEAKVAAEALNGNIIGGKKGGYYHDDIWNIKYLKGFKWDNLTEQIKNENAERAARLKREIWKTRKENKRFVEDVERGKMAETRESKKRERRERDGGDEDAGVKARAIEFKQKKARSKDAASQEEKPFGGSLRIGSKIF